MLVRVFLPVLLLSVIASGLARAEDKPKPSVTELLKTLAEGGSRQRSDAAEELAQCQAPEVVPGLEARAKEERNFHVRLAIHYALASHGDKSAVRVLLDSLKQTGHLGYVYLRRVAGVDFGWNVDGSSLKSWEAWYAKLDEAAFRRFQERRRLPKEVLDGGWETFLGAVTVLQEKGDRPKAAALFEKVVKEHPRSDHAVGAKELAVYLRGQIEEDKAWKEPRKPPPKRAKLEQRLSYAVHHLRNVNAYQWSQPGHCNVLDEWPGEKKKGYNAAVALLEIGAPAIPKLLELLDDRRPTRSVGYWRDFAHSRTVLRYQDAAIQVLNRLLPAAPYERTSTGAYLSNERGDHRAKVIAAVRAWAKKIEGKSELEIRWMALEYAPIYPALKLVKELAKKRGQKKKALEALHEMWEKRHWIFQPAIAEAMADLGDTSKVAYVLEQHAKNKYGSHLITHPDDGAAHINARDAANRLKQKYGSK